MYSRRIIILQAVGVGSRKEWCRHTMSKKELVGITDRLAEAGGKEEVLVEGQEVWEEWTRLVSQWKALTGGRGRRINGKQLAMERAPSGVGEEVAEECGQR